MLKIARKDAVAQGLKRYFTGVACPRGHIAERMVSTRACSECCKERWAEWGKNNPEKRLAQRERWVAKNPEKAKALQKVYTANSPEKRKARHKRYSDTHREQERERLRLYALANPEKGAARSNKRRAVKLQAIPKWADQDAIKVVYLYAKIRREFGEDVEVDHIYPLQGKDVCGLHVAGNLQVIPKLENRSKSNRHPERI